MEIKKGVTRIVFLVGKYAFKIPNFTHSWKHGITGILANLQERDNYQIHKILGTDHLLAPVRFCFLGFLQIMDRVTPINYLPDLTEFRENNLLGDDKPNNYGILNGRVVKIDYGSLN